jgi:hypothetical protein
MAKFEGTFESSTVPVRGPFTSLLALTSSESEGTSALQKTPDGTTGILFSYSAGSAQTPNSKVYFELYEDVEGYYETWAQWSTSVAKSIEPFSELSSKVIPCHWRIKVVQGSPLAAVYVNFQYI